MESVRNLADIGINGQKIISRLMANKNLVKLLYYTDKDPLNNPDLTDDQLKNEIFEKLIKIVPRVGPKETAKSIISVRFTRGRQNMVNDEFKDVTISVEVFVPLTQWIIKDTNLRPFAIMGEIQKSLDGKTINGLGKMKGGDFDLNFLTEEISAYEQIFYLTSYD